MGMAGSGGYPFGEQTGLSCRGYLVAALCLAASHWWEEILVWGKCCTSQTICQHLTLLRPAEIEMLFNAD